MEKKCYWDNLEMLRMMFPDRIELTATEVAKLVNRDVRTVKGYYKFKKRNKKRYVISISDLAREISL